MKKLLRVILITLSVGTGGAAVLRTLPASVVSPSYSETLTAYSPPADAGPAAPEKPTAPTTAVRSTVSGRVWEVYFRAGQRVRKGQLLLKVAEKLHTVEQRRLNGLLDQQQRAYDALVAQRPAAPTTTLAAAQERLSATRQQLAQTPAQLSFLFVMAPQDVVVATRTVAPGDYLTTANTIATLAAPPVDDATRLLSQVN
jgi:multidrug resistance efflux pump